MNTLWAITCYFNPAGYRNRLRNYRLFRSRLNVPLIAVELAQRGGFELRPDDADLVVQIQGGDVLWQKERLLNVALSHLPKECRQAAWVDCDTIFESDQWAERAKQALERYPMIHLFEFAYHLEPGVFGPPLSGLSAVAFESVVRKLHMGTAEPDDLNESGAQLRNNCHLGLAWAARRDVLEHHGFYDACILGSGDRAMLCAALGKFESSIHATRMQPRHAAHYLAWADGFHRSVAGQVGYIEGRVFHLWHGDMDNRRYRQRHEGLAQFDFDPHADLRLDPAGAWRWSGNKPEMRDYVREYFASRREDG